MNTQDKNWREELDKVDCVHQIKIADIIEKALASQRQSDLQAVIDELSQLKKESYNNIGTDSDDRRQALSDAQDVVRAIMGSK
jgi:hypothetical protein